MKRPGPFQRLACLQSRVVCSGLKYNFGKPPQQQSRRSGPEEAGETIRVR